MAEPIKVLSVNCNRCGAPLDVGEDARFATCAFCHAQLAVERTPTAAFTRVLEKIERSTDALAEDVRVVQLQNDLERADREWAMFRDTYLTVEERRRGVHPTVGGAVILALLASLFGGPPAIIAFALAPQTPLLAILGGVATAALAFAIALRIGLKRARGFERAHAGYRALRGELVRELDLRRGR